MKHTVQVWNHSYEVSVYQKSKTVWIAIGDYEGQQIEGEGRSETQALGSWRESATYKGNIGIR
jgi:hypothetical protein